MTSETKSADAALLSFDDLDAKKAGETPYEMEYLRPDGSGSGFFLQVLGAQSQAVQDAIARETNERTKKEKLAEAMQGRSGKTAPHFTPLEDMIAFTRRLAAVRIADWRGLKEPYTPELALKLCMHNQELAQQVLEASNDLGNFTKVSSPK